MVDSHKIAPSVFKQLQKMVCNIPQQLRDQLLIIDGKRLKGLSSEGHIVHLVELFAEEQKLVLAQEKVPDKSSESKVLNSLLKDIDVNGALISADALFATRIIAQKFLDHGADYLIGLKGNQGNFHVEAKNFFDHARSVAYKEIDAERYISPLEKELEKRTICVCTVLDWLPQTKPWPNLKAIIEVFQKNN